MQKLPLSILSMAVVIALGVSVQTVDAKNVKAKKVEKHQMRAIQKLSSVTKTNAGLHLKTKGLRRTIPGRVTELLTVTIPDSAIPGQTITADAFKMKKGNTIYTVILQSTTSLVNRNGQAITRADIAVGHKVSIRGARLTSSDAQYLASKVRDIALPIETTTAE